MTKLIQRRWGSNDNEIIRKRAYSDGEEDEAEAYKILEWSWQVMYKLNNG